MTSRRAPWITFARLEYGCGGVAGAEGPWQAGRLSRDVSSGLSSNLVVRDGSRHNARRGKQVNDTRPPSSHYLAWNLNGLDLTAEWTASSPSRGQAFPSSLRCHESPRAFEPQSAVRERPGAPPRRASRAQGAAQGEGATRRTRVGRKSHILASSMCNLSSYNIDKNITKI
jgi:hypothetical protein